MDVEKGYYDPFQPEVEGGFVSTGNIFGMDTDTVVVASVMCDRKHMDLRISEVLGLYDNIGSVPWTSTLDEKSGAGRGVACATLVQFH